MKEYDLQKLMNNPSIVDEKITELMEKKLLFKQDVDKEEVKGHLLKAEHNLRFIAVISKEPFQDWALTGCYYSCYHAALALIQTKGYTSKNHLATLCIIIKEFYKKELSKEDIEMLSNFLDYEDVLFYVETKNKREDATYSTKTLFDMSEIASGTSSFASAKRKPAISEHDQNNTPLALASGCFDKKNVEKLRIQATMFVNKIKDILTEQGF